MAVTTYTWYMKSPEDGVIYTQQPKAQQKQQDEIAPCFAFSVPSSACCMVLGWRTLDTQAEAPSMVLAQGKA